MSNPRIEEVSSDDAASDPEEMDLDAFDFARPQQGTLAPTTDAPSSEDFQAISQQPAPQQQQQQQSQPSRQDRERFMAEQKDRSKHYQSLYPVYFDSTRSREQGRRVSKKNAVPNPLAREIVEALQHIGNRLGVPLQIVFEPGKCHPKDWANPGRVRVLVKKEGRAVSEAIANSTSFNIHSSPRLAKAMLTLFPRAEHHLYLLLTDYLHRHPTDSSTPLKFRPADMPAPKDGKIPSPAIPRGFHMGTILPLHSPALSGGGVSENFLKDMMGEMGGQLPPGMEGMASMMGAGGGGGGKPKKIRVRR